MTTIYTPLLAVNIASIYIDQPLPRRMAMATPDTARALDRIVADLRDLGFNLRLSDLFRSYAQQKAAHADYVEGRKKAFSPAAGGSMHEAGRAMDIELNSIGVPLKRFWEIAAAHGFTPIIETPDSRASESWHFDCRGSHAKVYDYVQAGKAGSAVAPYTMMARSAIASIGILLDSAADQNVAFLQSALIRLGFDPGPIDGNRGSRTDKALENAGIKGESSTCADQARTLVAALRAKYPQEFA